MCSEAGVAGGTDRRHFQDFNASSMQVAKEGDEADPVNQVSIVEPIPARFKAYHRPIVTICAIILAIMMVISLCQHARNQLASTWPKP